ncbi:hypothetical protein NIES2111_68280 (plasmid) [Nostoc sp. NIES-2111]|nr:hypothetical protein NIES2111_68280 [Nostoc sp. NIES-2111]
MQFFPRSNINNYARNYQQYIIELIILFFLLIIFLIVNIFTSSRLPSVWLDEVMFTDPSANLFFGNGFTSSAWMFQSKEEFWAGNVPLHSIILYHWMQIFGFTVLAVRSINYVFMVISSLILWLSVLRLNLVTSNWLRISLIALFLLGKGITFNYRSGRYDCLSIFISTIVFLAFSIKSTWLRCVILTSASLFFPLAGLQTLPYIIICFCLLMIYIGKSLLKEFISIIIGLIWGINCLYLLYLTNGVWNKFILSVQNFSIYNKSNSSFIANLFNSLNLIPKIFFQDTSSVLLFILALSITLYQIKTSTFKVRSPLSFGLALFIVINVLIPVIRNSYVPYYGWMSFVPLAICTSSSITDVIKTRHNNLIRSLILFVLVLACLAGFPRELAHIVRNWDSRDYAKVESLVEKTIRDNDVVYSDFSAFYPVKKKNITVIFPTYLNIISEQEKQDISVLIFDPRNENRPSYDPGMNQVINKLGGDWYDTGYSLDSKGYYLKVFRRKSVAP